MRKLLNNWISEVDKFLAHRRATQAKSLSQREEIKKANKIARKRDFPEKPSVEELWKDF